MNKKLIITEEQYNNLKFFILESTFFDMADKTIKKGDTIIINTNGKELNFNVISNFSGQIYMDNIDKNSEYFGKRIFLTKMSFEDNNNLVIQVAKDDEQKNEEPLKGSTWSKMTLKNVEDIAVNRGGKLLDNTSDEPNLDEPNLDENKKLKERFLEELVTLKEGESLVLKTNGKLEELVLDFISKSSGFIHFELSESTEDALGNVNITGVDISTNEDDMEVDEDGLLTIKIITYESKDGKIVVNESKIQNITEFSVINTEVKKDDEEDGDDGDEEDSGSNLDAEKMQQYIENDPKFKKAILNFKGKLSPSQLASFANEWEIAFAGKSSQKNNGPDSSGTLKVKEILNSYEKTKLERFGNNFREKSKINFTPLDNVSIPYKSKGGDVDFVLVKGDIYDEEMAVYYRGIDDSEISKYKGQYNVKLSNNSFEIILKEKADKPNVYICDVVKLYKVKVKNNQDVEEIQTRRTPPQENVYIRLINSSGYKSEENQKN